MGIKSIVKKVGDKSANKIAKLAVLSPDDLEKIDEYRNQYLFEMPDPESDDAKEMAMRMLAANSVEIFNAYLPQLKKLYIPVKNDAEFGTPFKPFQNIRYFNITKWVTDKIENSLEKLVNVYEVLSNESCNIALIFHRTRTKTDVFLAVTNTENQDNNVDVNGYADRLCEALKGNFPGSEYSDVFSGKPGFLNNDIKYSVATASNIPAEKSEKFISQTIEKLLDGIVPDTKEKEYTLILLATPVADVEERKLRLAEFYSGLKPYAEWSTQFTFNEANALGASATFGLNVGASAGVQNGVSTSVTNTDTIGTSSSDATGENISSTNTDTSSDGSSSGRTSGENTSEARQKGVNGSVFGSVSTSTSSGVNVGLANVSESITGNVGGSVGASFSDTLTKGVSKSITDTVTKSTSKAIAETVGKTLTQTLGKTASKSKAIMDGVSNAKNFGANFGANFARTSNVTATIGKNETIIQNFGNYNIKHALELLEKQMKRYDQSKALGMWDFAAYILSEDQNVVSNVAHSYLALTEGEESFMSNSAVNVWRGDIENSEDAKEICNYLRELRHPLFGLNPSVLGEDGTFFIYPPLVSATTALSGKELAYSLNFPRKSITGLPVFECAEFGRNITTYDESESGKNIKIGQIYHMHHRENTPVKLSLDSLASHTFVTGSTGSGKSNTVYKILERAREASEDRVKFLVIEPAKGEYKDVFGNDENVSVYGTNAKKTPLLRINPFSFPDDIHVLEHLDRLVEIFNVCWPMYAAMPAVLKNAIEKSYEDCGWDLLVSENKYNRDLYPGFTDVARNVKQIIESSEYDAENKGAYKGSLLTRLNSLTNGINGSVFVSDEISNKDLFDENVIVDISRVGSSETKSLIMGMLVLKLQEYRISEKSENNAGLRHVTVLEEAHNILKKSSSDFSSESGNLIGKSVEMISNAIAEMRTYGEGFIIADQAPGLLDMAAIRNTNTKIIMRLPDQSDRELVGKSAGLDDDQITELAKLPCGVAAIYQNEWIQPVLCKVDMFEGDSGKFEYMPNDDAFSVMKTNELSDSLLDYIMNNEIVCKDGKTDIKKLQYAIIKSKLNSDIKTDFMEYILSGKNDELIALRKLVYDFLSADEAIESSKVYDNIYDWSNSVVDKLVPTIRDYNNRQINLALALVIYEQAVRDSSYSNLYCAFTEIYREKGGVI